MNTYLNTQNNQTVKKHYGRRKKQTIPADTIETAHEFPSNKDIAQNVKQQLYDYRVNKKITIKQLADLIGKSASTVSAWKKTTQQAVKPDYRDLAIMRYYFGFSLDEMFDKALEEAQNVTHNAHQNEKDEE